MVCTGDVVKDRRNNLVGVVTQIQKMGPHTRLARFTPRNKSLPGYWVATGNLARHFS